MIGKTESEKKEEYCRSCNIWLAPYEHKKHAGKYKYHPECHRNRKRRNGNGNFNFFKFINNGAKFANAPS